MEAKGDQRVQKALGKRRKEEEEKREKRRKNEEKMKKKKGKKGEREKKGEKIVRIRVRIGLKVKKEDPSQKNS